MVTELFCIPTGEKHLVHVHELGRSESAVGTVLLEPLVPLLDGGLIISGVRLEEVHVLLGQLVLAAETPHVVFFMDLRTAAGGAFTVDEDTDAGR